MNRDDFLDSFQNVPVDVYQHRTHAEPLVSVCVQTYQHVNFIKDCLDGILMQKTDFPFEILLGEDASTDGTREVCINYAENYPDKIRFFLHHRENNIKISGMPTGRFNFMYNLFTARGKYIAICEADDHWTDPYKLQKQVDFLETNPNFSMCFHNVKLFYEDRSQEPRDHCQVNQKEISTIEDLFKGNFISTCSVMFRRGLFGELPEWFYKILTGDWLLHILNAQYGDIQFINAVMGVHRIGVGGVWEKARNDPKLHLEAKAKVYHLLNGYFDSKYSKIIKQFKSNCYYSLAVEYKNCGDIINARHNAIKYIFMHFSNKQMSNRQLIALLLELYIPSIYKLYKPIRSFKTYILTLIRSLKKYIPIFNDLKALAQLINCGAFKGPCSCMFYPQFSIDLKKLTRLIDGGTFRDAKLCIDGYPRSANSFVRSAFQYSYLPQEKEIIHHNHSPLVVKYCIFKRIPSIILIRNPIDSVVSLMIYENEFSDASISSKLKRWYCYYNICFRRYKHSSVFLLAFFDDVVRDINTLFNMANDKFGFSINSVNHKLIVEKKRQESEKWYKSIGRSFSQFPLPHVEKPEKQAKFRESILNNPESEKCINLYKVIEERFKDLSK